MGVTREEFEQLPSGQSIRLVRITQTPRGFRSRAIVVATTLLDPVETPADDIRALLALRAESCRPGEVVSNPV